MSHNEIKGTAEELSKYIGVSVMRIVQLVQDGVIDREKKGEYLIQPAVSAYCEFLRGVSRGSDSAKQEQVERTRLTSVKADLAELEHAEKQGQLLMADAIHRQDEQLATTLRNNLFSMPDRITPMLAAESDERKIYDMLHNEISHTLLGVLDKLAGIDVDNATLDITRADSLRYLDKSAETSEEVKQAT